MALIQSWGTGARGAWPSPDSDHVEAGGEAYWMSASTGYCCNVSVDCSICSLFFLTNTIVLWQPKMNMVGASTLLTLYGILKKIPFTSLLEDFFNANEAF